MKLLMISTDRNIFDKESKVALRQLEYAKKYEEVHIIVFTSKNFTETSFGPNIWVYPTRSSSRWFYIFDALKLGRFITERKMITDVTCQDPFETGLVGALIKNRHQVNLELQVHTDISSRYFQTENILNRIRISISKYTLTRADTIRVVSEKIKKYLAKIYPSKNIEVRPIGVDIEKIRNTLITTDLHKKYPQFSKIILMVSRLEPEKDFPLALNAFSKIIEKLSQAGLVIVGSGSEQVKLAKMAQELKLEKSVIFEGWQNDVVSYYKTCDCFLVTSKYEGYGLTLAEAHAAGSKIVSTDVGIAREVGAHIVDHTKSSISEELIKIL